LARAELNLREYDFMGISPESYGYRYQENVIALYQTALEKVSIEPEYAGGWETYFDYEAGNVLLFAAILLIGTVIFAQESNSGFQPLIRISRYGRGATAAAKLLTMGIATVGLVLLFVGSSFVIIGLRMGYSDPGNAVQLLARFRLCPYVLTSGNISP
jgi:hypothetical protein